MATPIENGTISGDLKDSQGIIFSAEALPNSTNKLSSAFLLGQTMAGVEAKIVCETGGTLTAAVVIELQTSATEGGTYVTQVSKTVPLGAIVAGDMLAGLILPREVNDQIYTKIKLTTTADESAMKVDAYLVYVS